jgi:hypothetical protein
MKYIIILMSLFVISNAWAADTVWVVLEDTMLHHTLVQVPTAIQSGDDNGDGHIDMDDVVYKLDYIFGNGPSPVTYPTVLCYTRHVQGQHIVKEVVNGECVIVAVYPYSMYKRYAQPLQQEWGDTL